MIGDRWVVSPARLFTVKAIKAVRATATLRTPTAVSSIHTRYPQGRTQWAAVSSIHLHTRYGPHNVHLHVQVDTRGRKTEIVQDRIAMGAERKSEHASGDLDCYDQECTGTLALNPSKSIWLEMNVGQPRRGRAAVSAVWRNLRLYHESHGRRRSVKIGRYRCVRVYPRRPGCHAVDSG